MSSVMTLALLVSEPEPAIVLIAPTGRVFWGRAFPE